MPSREDLEAQLVELRQRNREKTLARLQRVRALLAGETATCDESVRGDIHALIGSLGTYGWPGGSDLLAEIRERTHGGGPFGDLLAPFDTLIAEIHAGRPATPWR